MLTRFVSAQLQPLAEDQVRVRMSTAQLARDGHILVPQGADLTNFRRNPIVLWSHNPEEPVGTASEIETDSGGLRALITFAPLGASPMADRVRSLVKAGIIRGVSIGFEPIEHEPLDPKKPRGGQRISRWELLECSFVSIPADTGAAVTARGLRAASDAMRGHIERLGEQLIAADRHLRAAMDAFDTDNGKAMSAAHRALGGALRAAGRIVGRMKAIPTPAVTEIQTSSGIQQDGGAVPPRAARLHELHPGDAARAFAAAAVARSWRYPAASKATTRAERLAELERLRR